MTKQQQIEDLQKQLSEYERSVGRYQRDIGHLIQSTKSVLSNELLNDIISHDRGTAEKLQPVLNQSINRVLDRVVDQVIKIVR
jgi:uncharacterized coiled-coil protein SlyX